MVNYFLLTSFDAQSIFYMLCLVSIKYVDHNPQHLCCSEQRSVVSNYSIENLPLQNNSVSLLSSSEVTSCLQYTGCIFSNFASFGLLNGSHILSRTEAKLIIRPSLQSVLIMGANGDIVDANFTRPVKDIVNFYFLCKYHGTELNQ